MRIPDSFKNKVKAVFYDKTIYLIDVAKVKDSEGFVKRGTGVITGSFLGNAQFDNLEKIAEDYGLEDKIDMTITTDENIDVDQTLKYQGVFYKVVKAMPRDSHYFLLAQKWSLRSTTSISA